MMGYYRNDEATKTAIQDNWLYTGDFGSIDDAGNLAIRGRKKEIIVLATGKNVTPPHIEGLLTSSALIDQAMVIGDDRKLHCRPHLPDAERIGKRTQAAKYGSSPARKNGTPNPTVRQIFEEEIASRVATAGHWEQVKAFTLLDRPFTIDADEVTPELSLPGDVIIEHFRETIEAMYVQAEPPEDRLQARAVGVQRNTGLPKIEYTFLFRFCSVSKQRPGLSER